MKRPSFHQNDSLFSKQKISLVIPVSNEAYQNSDSDTTEGEKLVNKADLIYSEKAKNNGKTEREDQDIIEAGDDNLENSSQIWLV